MPIQISAKELIGILRKRQFEMVSRKGSHIKMRKHEETGRVTVIVPNHKNIKPGTLGAIMKRARLTRNDILFH